MLYKSNKETQKQTTAIWPKRRPKPKTKIQNKLQTSRYLTKSTYSVAMAMSKIFLEWCTNSHWTLQYITEGIPFLKLRDSTEGAGKSTFTLVGPNNLISPYKHVWWICSIVHIIESCTLCVIQALVAISPSRIGPRPVLDGSTVFTELLANLFRNISLNKSPVVTTTPLRGIVTPSYKKPTKQMCWVTVFERKGTFSVFS